MSTTPKELESLSLAELREIVARKEQTEKDVLLTEIAALEKTLAQKRDELSLLTGKPAPKKLGKKTKTLASAMRAGSRTPSQKAKGKRGAVGEKITAFVASKGKAGAHVKDIAAATGFKVPNITAFFYSKSGKTKFKNLGSATFTLKK